MNFRKDYQFKSKARYISSLALALVSLLAAGEAKAASFSFTKIADTTNVFLTTNTEYNSIDRGLGTEGGLWGYSLDSDPNYQAGKGIAIGHGGWVAYHAQKTTSSPNIFQDVINIGLGGSPQTVATTGTIFDGFGQGIAINVKKQTAYIALSSGNTNIYVNAPGEDPKLIASSTDGYDFAPGVSINDSGDVAFTARDSNGYTNVYKAKLPPAAGSPSVITRITNCSAVSANGSECPVAFEAPSINNSGVVSFSSENGIFVGDGGPTTPIISNNPTVKVGSYREANINDNPTNPTNPTNPLVSGFVGISDGATPVIGSEGQIIFSGDGTTGSVIAGNYTSSWGVNQMFQHLGTSSINNRDNVVLMGQVLDFTTWSETKGIFIVDDPVNHKLIGVGDRLDVSDPTNISIEDDPANFGNTLEVIDLVMDRGSLSNENEIAFWARFADGTEGVYRANKFADSQFNPWLPNCPHQDIGTMSFCGVTSGEWYDPPTAYGFHYEMDSDSLFTSILDLPSTFENPFTVMVEDIVLGEFSNGDEINFNLYADLLGDLLVDGSGVKRFTVRTNDAIDPTDPMALPIKLAFNTDIADFTLSPVEGDTEKVPEPGMILGLLSVGAFLVSSRLQRK